MEKRIAVFGSGIVKESSPQFKIAYEIGFFLASSGFTVVNGGYGGSMLASAKGAKEAGGKTIGVTTDDFGSAKNQFIDQEIRKKTWQGRLHQLIKLADGYVVLDGGTGTLTEFMVVWEMASKKFHKKPIVALGRYVKSLIQVLKKNPEVKFPNGFQIVSTPKTVVQYLVSYFNHAQTSFRETN